MNKLYFYFLNQIIYCYLELIHKKIEKISR